MDTLKLDRLRGIVEGAPHNAMRTKRSREALAHSIASELGIYGGRVQEFVHEMAGLNFFIPEERALFLQFAERGL